MQNKQHEPRKLLSTGFLKTYNKFDSNFCVSVYNNAHIIELELWSDLWIKLVVRYEGLAYNR
jgi:hypothetical protein